MAFEDILRTENRLAAADLSASMYCFVRLDSSGNVNLASTGTDAIGVLYNKPSAAGRSAQVVEVNGVTVKVKIGAAVTAGDLLASDSTGRAVTATTSHYTLAQALQSGTTANQIISAVLRTRGSVGP